MVPHHPSVYDCVILELGLFPDQTRVVRDIFFTDPLLGVLVMVFLFVVLLTFMQLLIGILVEVVGAIAAVDREQITDTNVRHKLTKIYNRMDANRDDWISRHEFTTFLQEDEAVKVLSDMGVDVVGVWDCLDFIFKDGKSIDFDSFLATLLSLRGSNVATVKDIVDLRLVLMREIWAQQRFVTSKRGRGRNHSQQSKQSVNSVDPSTSTYSSVSRNLNSIISGSVALGSPASAKRQL